MTDTNARKKRLLYRSWHCGTRELDLIMGQFAETHMDDFSDQDLSDYESLLTANNPDLFAWLTGADTVPDQHKNHVTDLLIQTFVKSKG